MRRGGKTALKGDLRDGKRRSGKQHFGMLQPFVEDILFWGNVHHVFENMPKAVIGILRDRRKLLPCNIREEIFVDIIKHLMNDILVPGRALRVRARGAFDLEEDIFQKIADDLHKIRFSFLEFRVDLR